MSSERAGRVSVFANAAAGSADRDAVAHAVARLAARVPVRVHWCDSPDDLLGLVDAHRDDDLVFAGGDGSLHLALGVLRRLELTDRPIGVLPLGTGNDFARNAGIPLDADGAVDTVLDGAPSAMDAMVTDGGELVMNSAHFGLGVVASERATPLKSWFGRAAYPLATAAVGLLHSGVDVTVIADAEMIHRGRALAVVVLLGPGVGGGTELVAGPARGLETLVVAAPDRRIDRLGLAIALRRDASEHSAVRKVTADRVELSATDELSANLDGEIELWGRTGSLTRLTDAWRVWVPERRTDEHV